MTPSTSTPRMAATWARRDRLLVGDDRQRLERGGRQPGRLALEHEALDVGREVGMALEAVAAGDPHQHEARVLGLVRRGQLGAQLLDRVAAAPRAAGRAVGSTGSSATIRIASMARGDVFDRHRACISLRRRRWRPRLAARSHDASGPSHDDVDVAEGRGLVEVDEACLYSSSTARKRTMTSSRSTTPLGEPAEA